MLTLFDQLPRIESPKSTGNIRRDFERFHKANPHVYAHLVRICREMKSKGLAHWSMKAAFEVLRYQAIQTFGEDWKLNNNYTRHYALLVMDTEADLGGFFKTREAA